MAQYFPNTIFTTNCYFKHFVDFVLHIIDSVRHTSFKKKVSIIFAK